MGGDNIPFQAQIEHSCNHKVRYALPCLSLTPCRDHVMLACVKQGFDVPAHVTQEPACMYILYMCNVPMKCLWVISRLNITGTHAHAPRCTKTSSHQPLWPVTQMKSSSACDPGDTLYIFHLPRIHSTMTHLKKYRHFTYT